MVGTRTASSRSTIASKLSVAGGASAERSAGAGDHQHAEVGVGVHSAEEAHELPEVDGLDPVQVARTVEADGGAAAGDLERRDACCRGPGGDVCLGGGAHGLPPAGGGGVPGGRAGRKVGGAGGPAG